MKKLFYLLPFLFLNFVFSYDFGFYSVLTVKSGQYGYDDVTDVILVGSNGWFYIETPFSGRYHNFNIYKSENALNVREHDPYPENSGFLFADNLEFDHFYGHTSSSSRLFYYIERTPVKCYYPNSVVPCFTYSYDYWKKSDYFLSCDLQKGEYLNTDTGQCDTNCDLIPNLKFRSDCQCNKAGLGGFVSSSYVSHIINDNAGGDIGSYCEITCDNGVLKNQTDDCFVDDTFNKPNDNNTTNDDNNNNNDDNSTGGGSSSGNLGGGGGPESDYCKDHPEICNPQDNNNTNPPSGGGGSTGGNTGGGGIGGGSSTGGGNNGGNNNNDNDPNGHETTPSGGDNPPSDDTGDDDGECKGDECNVDYGGIDDLNNAVSDGINKITGIFDDAKGSVIGVYDTIKKGGLSDFRSSCGGNCGRVFYFELPNKRIPVEVNLCEITDNFKSVLYLIFYALFVTIFSIAIFKFVARLI